MPDPDAIDQALIEKLLADAALMALAPDGVFWEIAGDSLVTGGNAERFVVVSLVESVDEPMFGGTAFEDCLYAVKAVMLSTVPGGNVRAAAARIQTLLHYGDLTIPDYHLMVMRRRSRLRMKERDGDDSTIFWYHLGGNYHLMAAPL